MNALANVLGEQNAAFPPIVESISTFADTVPSTKDLEASFQVVRAKFAAQRYRTINDQTGVSGIFSDEIAKEPKSKTEELADRQAEEEVKRRIAAQKAAEMRLEELKKTAAEEGYEVSLASERALKAFLSATPFTRRPYISLLDNGNVRAFWEDKTAGEQIGLQFLDRYSVQFVIFVRRERDGKSFIARAAGRDLITNIDAQIKTDGLHRLMA